MLATIPSTGLRVGASCEAGWRHDLRCDAPRLPPGAHVHAFEVPAVKRTDWTTCNGTVASEKGQEDFNPKKGSIPARTDVPAQRPVGCENTSALGLPVEGAEDSTSCIEESAQRLVAAQVDGVRGVTRGQRKAIVRLHPEAALPLRGGALQPSCAQAAVRLYSRSSPPSLVITIT